MRHSDKVPKLRRDRDHRRAMLNNLATSVLLKGCAEAPMERQVRTTVAKAKAVRTLVDRLITYAKKGDLTSKKMAAGIVKDRLAFKELFSKLGERYKERQGGYTRVLKLANPRHGDNAEMAIISLVENEITKKPKKPKAKSKVKTKASVESKAVESASVVTPEEAK